MKTVQCVIFDFAGTISSSRYFQTPPQQAAYWKELFDEYIFADNEMAPERIAQQHRCTFVVPASWRGMPRRRGVMRSGNRNGAFAPCVNTIRMPHAFL
jgi:hypothetical protein